MKQQKAEKTIDICRAHYAELESAVRDVPFEHKGIFHSEMLLLCAMAEHLGATQIIESGLARGQSTHVMAAYFAQKNVDIDTVERRKHTGDSLIARRRLAAYSNVRFHYKDAFAIVPRLVRAPCVVLVDGPKGFEALLLASMLLAKPEVRAVFLHDVHRDSEARELMERLYPHAFFTDNEEFVHAFARLDEPCWNALKDHEATSEWAPYRRGAQTMQSYGATLGMVVNLEDSGFDPAECVALVQQELTMQRPRRSLTRRGLSRAKFYGMEAAAFPFWMARHYIHRFRSTQHG